MKYGKWLILLMTLCLIFSFAGCGGGGGGGDEPDPPAPETPWLCFTANEAGSTVSTVVIEDSTPVTPRPAVEYSTDGGTTWHPFVFSYYEWGTMNPISAGTTVTLEKVGDKMYLRATGQNEAFSEQSLAGARFIYMKMTGSIAASGNVMSLLDKSCESKTIPTISEDVYCCFGSLFENCMSLTSAPELPAATLAPGCYFNMFVGCEHLYGAPTLPATTLKTGCYMNMFLGCTSLTSAPELPATVLVDRCYYSMFNDCVNLKNITVHFTDWNEAENSTKNWVENILAGGHFYCPAGLVDRTEDDSKVPTGWTVHDLP